MVVFRESPNLIFPMDFLALGILRNALKRTGQRLRGGTKP
jgi:hypothetical protein